METEKRLVEFVRNLKFEDLPFEAIQIAKYVILTVSGTVLAGKKEDGIQTLLEYYRQIGGAKESTVLIYGDKLPAENAALINATMARAIDFCDAMVPGLHMGSTAIPTAFASSELKGKCNGKEFITALVSGLEVGARLNLSEEAYNGFDPTGVCAVFVSTAIASRILGLSEKEMLNAFGLAFNRCGGSFQSNIDGTLAVRIIQGWTAQSGIICARYARSGLTGPGNFLEGLYGFYHLFGRDLFKANRAVEELGKRFHLEEIVFKKYPSCGVTQASIEATLMLIRDRALKPEDVEKIEIEVPPYAYRLVGHDFKIGENPKVDAQFNIKYCVASTLMRGSCEIKHFDEPYIRDESLLPLIGKIQVRPSLELQKIDHTALFMRVFTKNGESFEKAINKAPGFPGNPLSYEEHKERFFKCVDYAGLTRKRAEKIVLLIEEIEKIDDIKDFIELFKF